MAHSLQSLVDAYAAALASFGEVAGTLGADEWPLPTECPGWTVRDQVAHVLALELQLAGHPVPPRLTGYGAHVRNPVGELMESGIAGLADLSTTELVARLGEASGEHLAQLRGTDLDDSPTVVGIMGTEVPLSRFLPVRVFDVWAHEQDVRRATGRPVDYSGPGAEVSLGQVTGALPYLIGKQIAPPAGTSVALDVSGERPLRMTVTVGSDGRAEPGDGVADGATTTLRMSTDTLMRLAGGRVDPVLAEVEVRGDAALGRQVLDALAITP